jgi:hypothetical protein
VRSDLEAVFRLARTMSGGSQEELAYVEWLWQRTQNLLRDPDFVPAVNALTVALLKKNRLSGAAAKRIIREALESRSPVAFNEHEPWWNIGPTVSLRDVIGDVRQSTSSSLLM